jgi:hypothetical protein
MNGTERVLGADDMMMVDGKSIICSVLHGPDRRTRITPETQEVFFAVYAPAGVGETAVQNGLRVECGHVGNAHEFVHSIRSTFFRPLGT